MKIAIVGAGGAGREMYSWMMHANAHAKNYQVIGFIDDNKDALLDYDYPIKVMSSVQDYVPGDECLVVSIAAPATRQKIVYELKKKRAKFYTFIHPSVIIGANSKVGEGCVICPGVIISCDTELEEFVMLNTNSTIGHDSHIGQYTTVNGKVEITGNNQVGELVFFGVGARIIPSRKIGDRAIVGAGSVVIRNVKPDTTVFGNPAKAL
jgi:sugar O-acyltransferase (sialic acid O-acetyltransferase NeuD family)